MNHRPVGNGWFLASAYWAPSRPSPASRARMMACALSATCSLVKMLETWLRTVLGLRWRRFAVPGLVSWAGYEFRDLALTPGKLGEGSRCPRLTTEIQDDETGYK